MLLSYDWWQTVLKGCSSREQTILRVVATSLGVATMIFRNGNFLLKWKPYKEHLGGRSGCGMEEQCTYNAQCQS